MTNRIVNALALALVSSAASAATNLVSNTVTVTNRTEAIVTYVMSNGVAVVNDPSGRLIGTAEEQSLKIAAEHQTEIASAAADAAGNAMEEWYEFVSTTDVKVVYIAADFAQDLPALAPNICGWVAKSEYDGTYDRYFIWWNREMDYPPSLVARITYEGGTAWIDGEWEDYGTEVDVRGVPCRVLKVKRRNANCVVKAGTVITLGGRDGFDADVHKINIEIGGVPAVTSSARADFWTVTMSGTNRVVRAYTNGFFSVENGFVKEPTDE